MQPSSDSNRRVSMTRSARHCWILPALALTLLMALPLGVVQAMNDAAVAESSRPGKLSNFSGGMDVSGGLVVMGVVVVLGLLTLQVGGWVTAVANGIADRPDEGWQTAGHAFAGLNLAVGTIASGIGLGQLLSEDDGNGAIAGLVVGGIFLVTGTVGLVLTIKRASLSDRDRIALLPIVCSDGDGHLALGMGIGFRF